VCEHFAARGVALAQVLLDPADRGVPRVTRARRSGRWPSCCTSRRTSAGRTPPRRCRPGSSGSPTPPRARPLRRHDRRELPPQPGLPGANGVRDIEDVVAGHKASGDFDPAWWFMLCDRGARGPCCCSAAPRRPPRPSWCTSASRPAARGAGLGDLLMRQPCTRSPPTAPAPSPWPSTPATPRAAPLPPPRPAQDRQQAGDDATAPAPGHRPHHVRPSVTTDVRPPPDPAPADGSDGFATCGENLDSSYPPTPRVKTMC
jgi:hypothetical protein